MTWRMGGFGTCGCCACEDCCNNDAPDEVLVDLAFDPTTDYMACQRCSDMLTGTFTVGRYNIYNYGSAYCDWTYTHVFTDVGDIQLCEGTGFPSGSGISSTFSLGRLDMRLKVRCASATTYAVSLEVWQSFFMYPRTPPYPNDPAWPNCCGPGFITFGANCQILNYYAWDKVVPMSGWSCRDPLTLDFYDRTCDCGFGEWGIVYGACDSEWYPCSLIGSGTVDITPI